jgi:hypothetical protein
LLLIGVSLCEVLELVVSFPTSPSSLKTDFICISYCVFEFGGFTGSFLWEVLTSPYLIFYLLLILGLYVVHWIGLSLSFSKSPSLLKTEFGCKSYRVFRMSVFAVFQIRSCSGLCSGLSSANYLLRSTIRSCSGLCSGAARKLCNGQFSCPIKGGFFPNGW